MPKVSVIIPTYNSINYLCKTIESVLDQSFKDYEIIVVDDGSTDNTKDVSVKYDGKIRYFFQTNRGVAAARNKGLREAKGEYVAFLDHDDLYLKDFLFELLSYLEKFDYDFVIPKCYYRGIEHVNAEIELVLAERESFPGDRRSLYSRLFKNFIGDIRMIAKRSCFEKAGNFDENFLYHDDLDIWLRFANAGLKAGLANNSAPLYIYRVHTNSMLQRKYNKIEGLFDEYKLFKKHIKLALKIDRELRKIYGERLWEIGKAIICLKNYRFFGLATRIMVESQIYDMNLKRMSQFLFSAIRSVFKKIIKIKPAIFLQ